MCPLHNNCTEPLKGRGSRGGILFIEESTSENESILEYPMCESEHEILKEYIKGPAYFAKLQKCVGKFSKRNAKKCKYWLDIEVEWVKPSCIITLGKNASEFLHDKPVKLKEVFGKKIDGIYGPYFPCFSLRKVFMSVKYTKILENILEQHAEMP